MSFKMPDPNKAVHVKRNERRTPDGVKSCTTNVKFTGRRDLRLFRDEQQGKAPEWTYDGRCYRPIGKWIDTDIRGEYVTNNTHKENVVNEKDLLEQQLLDQIVHDDNMYNAWRKYSHLFRDELPLYPGSAIRNANIKQMQEFIAGYTG